MLQETKKSMSRLLWDSIVADTGRPVSTTPPAELVQCLEQQPPCLSDLGLDFVRTIKGRHSELREFRSRRDDGTASVLIKRITRSRSPAAATATVVREFNALDMLSRRLEPELNASIPRAFFVIPDSSILLLERLEGVPLSNLLKRDANRLTGLLRGERACRAGFLAGQWLRQFHDATRQPPILHDHQAYVADLTRQLQRCEKIGLDSAAEEILGIASRASQQADRKCLSAAARHGDFIPQNILVNPSSVAVIDFENFSEQDAVYQDLGTFIAYLTMLEGRPVYSARALRAMTASFRAGYGQPDQDRMLDLYVLKAQITTAAEFRPRRGLRALLGNTRTLRAQILNSARALVGTPI
jgi:hypothetical protein